MRAFIHGSPRSVAVLAVAVPALLLAACGDSTTPDGNAPPSLGEFHGIPDGTTSFLVRDSAGRPEVLSLTQATHATSRTITIEREGRPVLQMAEHWERSGNRWRRATRTVSTPTEENDALIWRGQPIDDAAMTRAHNLTEAELKRLASTQDVAFADPPPCMGEALSVLAAGLVAEGAIAMAVAAPNPITVLAALAAIANVAKEYDKYIDCLQEEM